MLSTTTYEDTTYENNHYIRKETAVYRKSILSDVHYSVNLTLPKGDWFCGFVKVNFELTAEVTKPLWIDFRGKMIGNFTINGQAVTGESHFNNHQVHLPKEFLKLGSNEITVHILNKYRKDGVGLHSFIDKADGV
jgi:aminopeptidase N